MNKKNLILTPTANMNRQEWLDFRQPLTHVKAFFEQWKKSQEALDPVEYNNLKVFFASEEWKIFQFPCIGASEVAAIMGLNPYKSIIELYFEKIGAKPVYDNDNVAMFWGRELEEQIADKWQYWDGTPEGMIENYKNKNVLRKCRRLNSYVQHKELPWLFASLDRVINKTKTGEEVVDEGSLECKTISGWSSDMWESGIPVMYVAQLQAQLIASGLEFGEIAILKDGRFFDLFVFDKSVDISHRLTNMITNFSILVKAGIEQFLFHSHSTNEGDMQQHYANLETLAPEPDGSEAYKNYLSDRYKDQQEGGIPGGIEEVVLARTYKFYGERMKEFEREQTECANRLKAFMKEVTKLDLGEDGSCTWRDNGKGSRTFRVNVKVDPAFIPEKFKANNSVASVEMKVIEHTKTEKEFKNDGKRSRKKVEPEQANRGE